jgi:hypothetical protein
MELPVMVLVLIVLLQLLLLLVVAVLLLLLQVTVAAAVGKMGNIMSRQVKMVRTKILRQRAARKDERRTNNA